MHIQVMEDSEKHGRPAEGVGGQALGVDSVRVAANAARRAGSRELCTLEGAPLARSGRSSGQGTGRMAGAPVPKRDSRVLWSGSRVICLDVGGQETLRFLLWGEPGCRLVQCGCYFPRAAKVGCCKAVLPSQAGGRPAVGAMPDWGTVSANVKPPAFQAVLPVTGKRVGGLDGST